MKMYVWNLNLILLLFYELKNNISNSDAVNDHNNGTIEMGGDLMADHNFLDFNQYEGNSDEYIPESDDAKEDLYEDMNENANDR